MAGAIMPKHAIRLITWLEYSTQSRMDQQWNVGSLQTFFIGVVRCVLQSYAGCGLREHFPLLSRDSKKEATLSALANLPIVAGLSSKSCTITTAASTSYVKVLNLISNMYDLAP